MSFTITIQPSGHQYQCHEDETLLEAGLRQGFALPYGCRNGSCGSCVGKLLQGETDYIGGQPAAINDQDEAAGKCVFCQALPLDDCEIEVREIGAAKDIVVKTLPSRVIKLEKRSADVMVMQLKLPATERMQFLAGQYIDILLKDGRRRSFSLANAPHNDEFLELHIRQVPNGFFTNFVFNEMKEKALLRIEGPLGSFFLREDSERPIILMAGGTGFAPVKSIVEHAIEIGETRSMAIYWGVRSEADLYHRDIAESWAQQHDNIQFIPVLSEQAEWQGRTGFVHEAVLADHADLSAFDVYLCGPPPMINAAKQTFAERGLPEAHLYFDSFDYSADAQEALAAQA